MAKIQISGLALALVFAAAAPRAASAYTVVFEDETEPYPGLRLLERHTEEPTWRIYAARVDLCEDGVRVDARSAQQTRLSTPAWGDAMGAQLAVNGDFYRGRDVPTVYGDAVGVGQRWPAAQTGLGSEFEDEWYYRNYGWIAFGPDFAEFTPTAWVKENTDRFELEDGFSPREITDELPEDVQALVSGFSQLVVEGEALDEFPDRSDLADRHPRTAMGLSEDRETFILAVVDGRSVESVGMRGHELAELMRELGAHNAFNLDGGGSSQMWLDGEGLVNQPSETDPPRAVANHWGVFAGGEGEPTSCARAADGGDEGGGAEGGDAGAGDPIDAGGGPGADAGIAPGGDARGDAGGGGGCAAAGGNASGAAALAAALWALLALRMRARPATSAPGRAAP